MTAEAVAGDQPAAAPAAQAPPPKEAVKKGPGFWKSLGHRIGQAFQWADTLITWSWPPVLAAVGFGTPYAVKWLSSLFPILEPMLVGNLIAVVVVGALGLIAILVQGAAVNDDTIPIMGLIRDNDLSGFWWALTWAVAAVVLWTGHYEMWYLVVPALYSPLEFRYGSRISFRNAYQRVPYDSRQSQIKS